jgi:hypothetical protein
MILVSLADVTPGQTLAKAVTNASGAVLCPPGFQLTEAVIQRLKNAGIESVVLEGGIERQGSTVEERLAELELRFQGVNDPIMLQLKATIEKRLTVMHLG